MKHGRLCTVCATILAMSWLPAMADESLELEGTTITGNRELPKALHIVPWKTTVQCRAWWMKSWRPLTAMS